MGYVKRRKQITLNFEDEELAGLFVRAHSTSLGQMLDLMDLADMERSQLTNVETKARLMELFELFASCLIEWNLESEDAGPTPMTVDGLLIHDFDFVLDLVFAWQDGVVGVRAPLGQKSADGKPSVEEQIPMETL